MKIIQQKILPIASLFIALMLQPAQASWWPPVQSKVVIVLRGNTTSFAPMRFDYTISHLGIVQYQGSIPLTPSHHSLIAAGGQYKAYESAACATAASILPNPSGVPIQVERVNYYLLTPANIRQIINKTQEDCP